MKREGGNKGLIQFSMRFYWLSENGVENIKSSYSRASERVERVTNLYNEPIGMSW